MATITRTGRQIVQKALRKLHVIGQGQTLEAEQENDALSDCEEMLAMWSVDGLVIPALVQESFALVAGTVSYAIGSGATWDTDRPKDILGGFVRSGSIDYPLTRMSRSAFNRIYQKGISGRPTQFYYRDTYPNGIVYFDYTPADADTVYLELKKPLGTLTLTGTIALPGEYHEAMWSNLAVRLAPEYEVEVPRAIAVLADDSLRLIRRMNLATEMPDAMFDDAITIQRESYDIEYVQ